MDLRKIIFVCGMLKLIEGARPGEYRVSEFPCYGDVCNLRNTSQFCSETFKLCRDCEEIKDDCETLTQPRECNSYCIELAVRNALAKKEINETVCRVVSVMMNIDNGEVHAPSRNGDYFDVGSKITYSCNEGYEIQGYIELVCLEKGQWSQSAMPHCFDNRWKNYKYATIWLSIFVGALIVALICLICMFVCHKRREEQKLSRNSSQQPMQDEEQPFISDMPPETEQLRQPFNIGDDPLTEQLRQPFNIGDTPLTEQSYLNEEKDDKINVRADQAESHEANGLRKDQPGPVIVLEHIINVINNPAQSPETKPVSENKSTDTHSDQPTMKNEENEKLPTEESGETHALKETAEGKACKGTKPLPARDEEPEQLKESFDLKGTDSPEVVPAEDEETQLSRNETDQRQTFKKVGMQDRTFAKGDTKYDREKNRT